MKKEGAFDTLKKALALLSHDERAAGLRVLAMVVGMAGLETLGVASIMPFLAVLSEPTLIETNPALKFSFSAAALVGVFTKEQFLVILGACGFFLIIFSALFRTLTHYKMNQFIEMRRHELGSRLLENYLLQPYVFFLDRHSGDMSKTILSEVDQIIGSVYRPAYSMISYSVVVVALIAFLIVVNPIMALMGGGVLGALYGATFLAVKGVLAKLGRTRVEANKHRFMAASEAFGGIKDIKLLGRESSYLSRFIPPSKAFAETQAAHQTINQVPKYIIEALSFGGIIAIVLFLMLTSGGLSSNALGKIIPLVGLYAFSAYRLQPALQHVFHGLASLRYGHAAVDNLYKELNIGSGRSTLLEPSSASLRLRKELLLREVSFRYPNSERPSLSDITLRIASGQSIGIVGGTGAGKTSLLDLILGLLSPSSGSIEVDGIPVTSNNVREWQKIVGYVPQDIFLTDSSIMENIAFGICKEEIKFDDVVACARMAQIDSFIMEDLPDQYETVVGERGVRLSGGQRQRIGIARALYNNPDVLVFDEATSALDTLTEQAVMGAINFLGKKKTIIIVAHRLGTVRGCDKIVLLDGGTISQIGSYKQLERENKLFQELACLS